MGPSSRCSTSEHSDSAVLQDLDTIRSFAAAVAQATAFCARLAQTDELANMFSNPQFKVCCVVYNSSAGLIPALPIHYHCLRMTRAILGCKLIASGVQMHVLRCIHGCCEVHNCSTLLHGGALP